MIDAYGWLQERGAGDIEHAGGSLLQHLGRVRDRLASLGLDADLQLAGLTHAVYGTDGFPVALLGTDERDVLRSVTGSSAEEIVFRYGGCDRDRTWRALPATRTVWSRFTGEPETLGADALRAFADLSIVNELDVYERSPEVAARAGDYFRAVFPTWAPLASPQVTTESQRVLS
jgi:hypothetical protein